MSYANLVQQDMRLSILLVLEQDPGYSQNEHLLRRILGQVGHEMGFDRLRTELAWLEEQGLVTLVKHGDLQVVKLTNRGEDVALGHSTVPGVQRPRPQ